MLDGLKPVRTERLKDVCVARFEALILSGAVRVGEKLPPERDMAQQLGVSRPVVHDALVDISAKGLISMIPRQGAVVNDYRREGSLTLLNSLLNYNEGKLDPKLLDGLLNMRMLFETENARLAAKNRTDEHLEQFRELRKREAGASANDVDALVALDFEFHLLLAMATDNLLYPLLLNSFKPIYTNLARQFFRNPEVVASVFDYHGQLATAIEAGDGELAEAVMREMLANGEDRLRQIIAKQT
ncbi:MAG: FadR/GntR family transcriptional regulator [Desulfobacterales bacterium]|nr:FadR/GntR family transcriptional regulator [Desulfobacterales bacterium]